ncbi:nSTAND1 domain-containing NTPase [Sorangium sp. So ce1151]|uniref:nSTAND1 domain-containing NTPase n=1 Tax=Sorangium sp. So ce1151 TaxID=3133332 RepID=UPI003F6056E7
MVAAMDRAESAPSSPCEIVLDLLRATDAESPFAFVLKEQTYVRHLDGGAGRSASFPWSERVLDHLAAIQRERADPAAAAWLGEEVRAFLERLGWGLDEESIRKALDAGRPVHLTLRLGAAELYALPWELVPLGATGRPLGSLPGFLLRYEWPDTRTARPEPDPPPEGGRILLAWSAAGGVVPADDHLAAIRRACREGRYPGFNRKRDVVPHASLGRLREALEAGPVAVLHILCHGTQLDAAGTSYGLVLDADDRSGREIVDARALQVALADHLGSLRLVVLCACHGGDSGALDSRLGSVAQALHRAGIPAVVASRYPLAVDASVALTDALYRGLLVQERSLFEALLGARDRLRERASRAGWASLQVYARAADGPDLRPIVRRPYRGLLAFQEEHARYFFGREADVEEALSDLSALMAAQDAARPRFLICTGASGTGKSSLVLAGVVPALRARDDRWTVATLRPHEGWRASLQAALASRTDPGAPLLLVVDQLEELFTMISAEAEREAFIRDLWSLASHPGSGVSVIATLRVDFLARCGEIQMWSGDRFLEDMVYDEAHRVFIRRMRPEHLRRIIEQPAEQAGLALEEGLVEQMLKDAGDEPGALPLLEYTLDQMWQQRRGRLLTWEQYNDLGGVGGALEKKADAILAGFDDVRRQAARRLLAQLVALDCDTRLDRRRRVPLDRLRRGSPAEAAVFGEVLDTLARERLLVVSGGDEGQGTRSPHGGPEASDPGGAASASPVVEVAHEQLIRSWGTLRDWVCEDRQMLAELQQIDRWVEESRGFQDYVLDGDRLGHARGLLAKYAVDVGDAARKLIRRSERVAQRKRRWTVGVAVAASVAAVMMGVLAVWAIGERDAARRAEEEAEKQAQRAHNASEDAAAAAGQALVASEDAKQQAARAKWAEAKAEQEADVAKYVERDALKQAQWALKAEREAKQLAAEAKGAQRKAEQEATRAQNASRVASARDLLARNQPAPAAELLSAVSEPDKVDGWVQSALDVLGQGIPEVTLRGHQKVVRSAFFSPDGQRIVTISADGTARVWRADGSGTPVVLGQPSAPVRFARFSPDGQRIVTECEDNAACVWHADGSGAVVKLKGHKGAVVHAAFSPHGDRLVTGSKDGTACVFRVDGSRVTCLEGHQAPVAIAEFSPDGTRIVTSASSTLASLNIPVSDRRRGETDGAVRVWRADGSGRPIVFEHERGVFSAAFSQDGKQIVTASSDRVARVWNADRPDHPIELTNDEGTLTSAAFSPDGKRVVTTHTDTTARVWYLDHPGKNVILRGHTQAVGSAAFSPNGERIVTASRDGTARVWDVDDPSHCLVLRGHQHNVSSAAFSSDGQSIVTASEDRTARVWRAAGPSVPLIVATSPGGPREPLDPADGLPRGAQANSVDGKLLVTASRGKTARVWRADGSKLLDLVHDAPVTTAAFSPDGKSIVTASEEIVRSWPTDGSGTTRIIGSHPELVSSVAFSPDGKHIVTASIDGVARVWRADGAGAAVVLAGPRSTKISASFSPDGRRIVVTYPHSRRTWDMSIDVLQQRLRDATRDCLSPEMRKIYLGETTADAQARYEVCELAHGRAP